MSRVTDFDAVYAGSRDRLLLQLYAYCADAIAADDALNEAFISASRHWHRLASLDTLAGWLRERAIKRLDGRPRVQPATAVLRIPTAQNARLLATLGTLDATSRRLLIVRRLGDLELGSAAREVGLTDGAAEQALARATSALHGNGVDTTPVGLARSLSRLADDLDGLAAPPARSLRRAGARRRFAATTLMAMALAALAAGAGTLAASRPLASDPGTSPPPTTPPTSTTPTAPLPHLGSAYLITAAEVSKADPDGSGWRTVTVPTPPTTTSVYGGCVQAADNPPPDTSWVRDLATGAGQARSTLREVLQLAPTSVEAERSYRQILSGFALCEGHQLVDYARAGVVGERAHLIRLLAPAAGGAVVTTVVVAETGPAVTVLTTTSPAGRLAALGPVQLVRLAGASIDSVCPETATACSESPYTVVSQNPPGDDAAGGFLSVVDLPLIPGVTEPWVGTDPAAVSDNPSATACDETDFTAHGGSQVTSRSYVIPQATGLPTLFGLTETKASFATSAAARAFVSTVVRTVSGCHQRQATLSVLQSTSFASHRTSGSVWQLRQKVSRSKVLTFRVALVRSGHTVAQVTFTPVGTYDVTQADIVALARRTAVRLGQ